MYYAFIYVYLACPCYPASPPPINFMHKKHWDHFKNCVLLKNESHMTWMTLGWVNDETIFIFRLNYSFNVLFNSHLHKFSLSVALSLISTVCMRDPFPGRFGLSAFKSLKWNAHEHEPKQSLPPAKDACSGSWPMDFWHCDATTDVLRTFVSRKQAGEQPNGLHVFPKVPQDWFFNHSSYFFF